MIIGVAGKMGTGKDYICNNMIIPILKSMNKSYLQISFADQIKVNVMTKNNVLFEEVYTLKNSETRKLLQTEGTEQGRNIYGDDIWIKYFNNWLSVYKSRGIEYFICSDIRFKNEIEYIKGLGGIILKLNAYQRNLKRLFKESSGDTNVLNSIRSHISECDLDDLSDDVFDIVVENDIDDNIQSSYTKLYDIIYERDKLITKKLFNETVYLKNY